MNCDAWSCQTRGQFSFFRSGARLTIEFLADFGRRAKDTYHLERLCYRDPSVGQQDCTD
jgi:hypothetical protein